jgi:hypothetical protein
MQPAIGVWLQPVTGSHASIVHALLSLQLSAVPVAHAPAWHVSAPLQTFPSLQELPFAACTCLHPTIGSQLSVVHGLLSSQLSGVPARHVPAWQTSAPLQTLLSLQEMPFAIGVCEHPVVASHPSVVHGLPSLQSSALPGRQTPAWHVSTPLQTLESGHGVLFVTGVCTQPVFGSHVSIVQGLLSSQLPGIPGMQMPFRHCSAPLQRFASGHGEPFGAATLLQPVVELHASTVHGLLSLQAARWTQPSVVPHASIVHALPSLQTTGVPGTQAPPEQWSLAVQALLSLHGSWFGVNAHAVPSHVSVVQTFPSPQDTVCVQVWVVTSQTSTVQLEPSSQSESLSQSDTSGTALDASRSLDPPATVCPGSGTFASKRIPLKLFPLPSLFQTPTGAPPM